jgi:hypothetical protein
MKRRWDNTLVYPESPWSDEDGSHNVFTDVESIHARLKQKEFIVTLAGDENRAIGYGWVYDPSCRGTEIKDISEVLRDLDMDVSPKLFQEFLNGLPAVTAELLHKNLGADIRITSGAGDFDAATGYINRGSPEWLFVKASSHGFDGLMQYVEKFKTSKEALNELTCRLEDPSFRINRDPAVCAVRDAWSRPMIMNIRTGEPFRSLTKEDCILSVSILSCPKNEHVKPRNGRMSLPDGTEIAIGPIEMGETWETLDHVLVQWIGRDTTTRLGFCALRAAMGLPWSFPDEHSNPRSVSRLIHVFSSCTRQPTSEPSVAYNFSALWETASWRNHAYDSRPKASAPSFHNFDEADYLCEMRFPTFFEWTMRVRWSIVYSYLSDHLGDTAWIVMVFLTEIGLGGTTPAAAASYETLERTVCPTLARFAASPHCRAFRADFECASLHKPPE